MVLIDHTSPTSRSWLAVIEDLSSLFIRFWEVMGEPGDGSRYGVLKSDKLAERDFRGVTEASRSGMS